MVSHLTAVRTTFLCKFEPSFNHSDRYPNYMKRTICFTIIGLLAGIATSQAQIQKMISISGKIANHGTYTEIFLDSLGPQESVNVTLAPISADGSFTINTLVLKPDIYKLRLEDNNFIFMVISPGEKITLQTSGPKLDFSAKISGSPQTMDLYNTMNAIMPYNQRIDSLNDQYKTVVNTPKQDSVIPLIITEMGTLETARKIEIASCENAGRTVRRDIRSKTLCKP